MIAKFRKGPAWLTVPAVLGLAVAGVCMLTGPLSHAADTPKVETSLPQALSSPIAADELARKVNGMDADTQKKLGDPIKDVRFEATPFEKAIAFVREQSGCNIYVNWKSLEANGIDRTAPITLSLQNVPMRTVLRSVLQDVGGNNTVNYTVEDGVIMIAAADETQKSAAAGWAAAGVDPSLRQGEQASVAAMEKQLAELRLRAAQLGANPERRAFEQDADVLRMKIQEVHAEAKASGPVSRQTYDVHDILDVPRDQAAALNADQRNAMKDLVASIETATLEPSSTIASFNGVLIITASDSVHKNTRALLEELNVMHRERMDTVQALRRHAEEEANVRAAEARRRDEAAKAK